VVDEEALADGGAGVNVDAGARMGDLGDDARHQRAARQIKLMRQPVMDHRGDEG
jgi:hypothetical protein